MDFFKHFPKLSYTFVSDGVPFNVDLANILAHVKIMDSVRAASATYHDYTIQDGERPDTVAQRLYGSASYTWIVLVMNNILSLYDWPLTEREFAEYIADKYGSIFAAQQISIYKTAQGDLVDATTYGTLTADEQGSVLTAYEHEWLLNEAKRRIKVLPEQFARKLTTELKRLMA